MIYKDNKKSGHALSQLGMGCMRFPNKMGKTDLAESEKIVLSAIEKGINFFDTAYIYPGSEATLGHIIAKNNLRDQVYIATKLPLFKCHKYEDFDKFFTTQLQRLHTDYIDYYFMHHVTKLADWQRLQGLGIETWLAEKQQSGHIRQVGISFHGPQQEFLKLIDAHPWDFAMIQYNYINVHYQAGYQGLEYAHEKGIPLFIMEPLLGGRLAKGLPVEAQKLLASTGKSPVEWALAWLFNHPQITMVLSGMSSQQDVGENAAIAASHGPNTMTQTELDTIKQVGEIFSATYKIPCTSCNYCLPCPAKINIPDSFASYNASYSISRMTGIQQYATTSGGLTQAFRLKDCTSCGKCEKACPQEIKIIEELKVVRKRMEPWWFLFIMGLARKFMR